MVSLLLWWDPVHTASCVHSKSGISVSPVLWSSCIHALLVFKAKCCGASFWYQSFRLGSLTWDSELLWENSCDVIILKFVGSPTQESWDLIIYHKCAPPISLWFLLCLWIQNIFFGRFQVFFFYGCSALNCDLVFQWWEVGWSYSTPPSSLWAIMLFFSGMLMFISSLFLCVFCRFWFVFTMGFIYVNQKLYLFFGTDSHLNLNTF